LGRFGFELDIGPKTKFAHLGLLYIFHLVTKVIRAVD